MQQTRPGARNYGDAELVLVTLGEPEIKAGNLALLWSPNASRALASRLVEWLAIPRATATATTLIKASTTADSRMLCADCDRQPLRLSSIMTVRTLPNIQVKEKGGW